MNRRLSSIALYALAALPLAAMTVYAKWRWMQLGGFRIVSRALGSNEGTLTWLERLSFLRADLLVGLVLVPALLATFALLLRPRRRWTVTAVLVALAGVLFYGQVRALSSVGTFLEGPLAFSAVRFGLERPEFIRQYLPPAGLVKMLAMVALSVALAWWAGRHDPDRAAQRDVPRGARIVGAGAAGIVAVVLVVAWIPGLPATPQHRSMLWQALAAYPRGWAGDSEARASSFTVSADSLAGQYRRLVETPPSPKDPNYWGRASGSDVTLVVLETVTAGCLDLSADLAEFPTLQRLRANALIATRHYVVYPYSSLSNFSFLTGSYPPEFARAFMRHHANDRVPSLLWRLRSRGYRTVVYEPYRALFEDDPTMFRILGAEDQVIPGELGEGQTRPTWEDIARADSATVDTLVADIRRWSTSGRRFGIVFAPQITHGPWRNPLPGRDAPDLLQRCRSLVAIEDAWLGDIVRAVEQGRGLDSTLIVVTSDHGVRTQEEDPSFEPGLLGEDSFHVPFMLAARSVFDSTVTVRAVTSPVDVATTVQDLLGLERPREHEQGNAMWDPRLAERTTFLLAQQLFGANGYHRGDQFFQRNDVMGVTCVSRGVLRCRDEDVVPGASARADSVRDMLRRFALLQPAWLGQIVLEPEGAAR